MIISRKKRILTALTVAAGIILIFVSILYSQRAGSSAKSGEKSSRAVPVTVATVTRGDIGDYLSAIGTVTPLNVATIQSRVSGEIMAVYFKEGQTVQQGQLLALIDPRPYEVQYQQALGQLKHDEATLRNDIANLERDRELFRQNVIAAQTLDSQEAAVSQDRGSIITDRANLANAKLQLSYCHITAPFSGRIGLRMVDPGNIIQANSSQGIAVITQIEPITVVLTVPEDSIEAVMTAMKDHDLPALVYDRSFKRKLADGVLTALDNQIDTTTGTLKLKARFPNKDGLLFPNEFVNVKLLVQTLHDQSLIPQVAIQRSSLGAFVYVVQPDNMVALHKVDVALNEGGLAAIRSGLQPGELVVTDGVDRLQQGSPVIIRKTPAESPIAVNVAQ
jgi:multidrug efflux system membrane fusion protein